MDTLGKLTAPATAKIRQLQKIVQDIKKNDGGFLNKLRRLKPKAAPNVPARDYRDNREGDDKMSDSDFDDDLYEDPHDDYSYEPPPPHRAFTATSAASFQRGEYLDSCRARPSWPTSKPVLSNKASQKVPPESTNMGSDEEDYIQPNGTSDDDNYIEPAENPTFSLYEVPATEENSITRTASRLCPTPAASSHSLPPKPSTRGNTRSLPSVQVPVSEDEYEVCNVDEDASDKSADAPPPLQPKPAPRERSPKPPLGPRPDLRPKPFESRTLPVLHFDLQLPPKPFTLDLKRPKIPLPQFTSPNPPKRGSISAENGSADQNKDADIYMKPWYAATCDRKTAEDVLFQTNKDGAFMVRKSSGHDVQQPYTLVVFYNGRVYNIPIRFIPSTQQYALGRKKTGEEYFSSISHIIENHQRNPLVLIDSQNNSKDATKLCYPVKS
ncbi:B-cell linker protein isoform 2-T2 [Pholidichthys leucotaenia]